MNPNEPWADVGSRLPTDPQYWDGLARRIGDENAGLLEELRARQRPWWSGLADHSGTLAVLAAAAILAALTLFPSSPSTAEAAEADLLMQTIEPTDPSLRDLMTGSGPPQLEILLSERGVARP